KFLDRDDDKIALAVFKKFSDLDWLGEVHRRVVLIRQSLAHIHDYSPMIRSSASASGPSALPLLSRPNACLIASMSAPCCKANESMIALSRTSVPIADPAL